MANLNIESSNKNYGDNARKINNNTKRVKETKSKLIRDRGDTDPIKHSIEKINTKSLELNSNKTNLSKSFIKADKKDANIHGNERKGDKTYESKSKNMFDLKDDVSKDHSKAPVMVSKAIDNMKLNINKDRTPNTVNRKPLIKTITDTDDVTKKYKVVTLAEQKPQKSIEIKLPNFENIKRTKIPKLIDKNEKKIEKRTEEKLSSKTSTKFDKKFKHKRELASPTRSQDGGSPPTEIAKWSTNINDHTKPYYEAWINSTLAAMSNKKERMYLEKQKILKSFKKALEQRSKSPELFYENFSDERFTGRIKINHK
ncbi:unnamed protein product [Euphydryas editha]|uniref:Uncharacterized protein n=1 Tax=Euphydryas editha TaxID=104508 RepID=A0AAU9TCB6_EUPED|nr:unnamed protein product [Euphydryas editha]